MDLPVAQDHWPAGVIDLHCHGGGGASFEGDALEMARGVQFHRAGGTERIVISLVSNPVDRLVWSLGQVRELMLRDPGVLGAHLEGPFLSPARKGAHAEQHLIEPGRDPVARLLEAGAGVLAQITIAPEVPGALDAIELFVEAGVVVAVGHTDAGAATAAAAFDRGATLVTHVFNAMHKGRDADGPAAAALADPRVTLELIADGIHVPPPAIREVFETAPGRVALVSDALPAAGEPDGAHTLGELEVTVARGRATLAGTDTLAGSTLTLRDAVATAVAAGVSRDAALAAVTTTPARVLGLST